MQIKAPYTHLSNLDLLHNITETFPLHVHASSVPVFTIHAMIDQHNTVLIFIGSFTGKKANLPPSWPTVFIIQHSHSKVSSYAKFGMIPQWAGC